MVKGKELTRTFYEIKIEKTVIKKKLKNSS